MAPEFLVVTYLPTILHASGTLLPMALLAFGGGALLLALVLARRHGRFNGWNWPRVPPASAYILCAYPDDGDR
jgi:hypothetical protein